MMMEHYFADFGILCHILLALKLYFSVYKIISVNLILADFKRHFFVYIFFLLFYLKNISISNQML